MARIVVGIGGGIAAYKVATVVSRLAQVQKKHPDAPEPGAANATEPQAAAHAVQVVLTRGGNHFVGAATFAALCGSTPVTDTYDSRFPLGAHIELAEQADLLVIAPATARLLASCAHGTADDLLATLYLACECPVLFAPAMSSSMWAKAAVQRNVQQLQQDGAHFVGPESGWLSCRKVGHGRMSEPDALLAEINQLIVS